MSDSLTGAEILRRIANDICTIHDCRQLAIRLIDSDDIVDALQEESKNPHAIALGVLKKWSRRENADGNGLHKALNIDPLDHLGRKYQQLLLEIGHSPVIVSPKQRSGVNSGPSAAKPAQKISADAVAAVARCICSLNACVDLATELKFPQEYIAKINTFDDTTAQQILNDWSAGESGDVTGQVLYEALHAIGLKSVADYCADILLQNGSPGVLSKGSVREVAAIAVSTSVEFHLFGPGHQQAQQATIPSRQGLVNRPHACPQTAAASLDLLRVHEQAPLMGVEGHNAASGRNYADRAASTGHLILPQVVHDDNLNGHEREVQLRRRVDEPEHRADIEWGRERPFAGELTAELERLRNENEVLKQELEDLAKGKDSIIKREEQLNERERCVDKREKILAEREARSGLRERELVEDNEKQKQINIKLQQRVDNLTRQIELLKEHEKEQEDKIYRLEGRVDQLESGYEKRESQFKTLMETIQSLQVCSIPEELSCSGTAVIHQESTYGRMESSLSVSCAIEEGSTTRETVSSLAIAAARQMPTALPLSTGHTQQNRALVASITICDYAKDIEQDIVELLTSPAVWPNAEQWFAGDVHTVSLAEVFRQLEILVMRTVELFTGRKRFCCSLARTSQSSMALNWPKSAVPVCG